MLTNPNLRIAFVSSSNCAHPEEDDGEEAADGEDDEGGAAVDDGAQEEEEAEEGEEAEQPHGDGPPEPLHLLNTETRHGMLTLGPVQPLVITLWVHS